jgi:hypothetical protein
VVRTASSTYPTSLVTEALARFDPAQIGRVVSNVFEQINEHQCYALAKYRFAGFRSFPSDHCVEITYRPSEPGLPAREAFIDIALAADLLRRRLAGSDRDFICNRLKVSLSAIFSHLLPRLSVDFSGPSQSLQFCFSDDGCEGFLSFDVPVGSDNCIIPDLYILRDTSVARYWQGSDFADFAAAYRLREPILFWRGSTTGTPIRSKEDIPSHRRIAACRFIRRELGALADCKISTIVQHSPELATIIEEYLNQEGILATPVAEARFSRSQIYFDIAGNVSAWGTFRKFAMGCLVLRPEPDRELAYYRHLQAGVHYVSILPDLSDLRERVEWAISHPDQAAEIAYAGRSAVVAFVKHVDQHVIEACGAWLRRRYRDG